MKPFIAKTGKIIVPLLIIGLAIGGAYILVATKPHAKKITPKKIATIVQSKRIKRADAEISIEAFGVVEPAQSIQLTAEVHGKITKLAPNLRPGSLVKKSTPLVYIERSDYQLALEQKRAELATAQNELSLEQGSQLVAQKEFELLGEEVSDTEEDLILRVPQLQSLKSKIAIAQAATQLAALNLERTIIRAPFNASIESLQANIGSYLSGGSQIMQLTGSDQFWIKLLLPVDQLHWISMPDKNNPGSKVRLYNDGVWAKGSHRQGVILNRSNSIEKQGRLATLLVGVDDPLALSPKNQQLPPLLQGAYLRGEISCKKIANAISIKREYLRENNTLWIISADNTLEIRAVSILFKDADTVLIADGAEEGEEYITSNIAAPVTGMLLSKSTQERK